MDLETALNDVMTRFIYNLPESELNQPARLFFQIEQAYWYYEDFKADNFSNLPHFSSLKSFAKQIFSSCDLLSKMSNRFHELFSDFSEYKSQVPVCGCILLNPAMTKLLLVCSWDGKSWSFPRGKIDEGETEFDCAIREVFEETGYNAAGNCRPEDFIQSYRDQKQIRLFIGTNVPDSTEFICQTRKEVSNIQFYPIDKLPKVTFDVHPFIPSLKRWIKKKSKKLMKPTSVAPAKAAKATKPTKILKKGEELPKVSKKEEVKAKGKKEDSKNKDTFSNTAVKRWSVEDMFKANAKITGKDYDYDGNPHNFGASHPKYINYNSSADPNKPVIANQDDYEKAFYEMSLQSHHYGHKILRGKSIDANQLEIFNNLSSQEIETSNSNSFTFFTRPFVLHTADVMKVVDLTLKSNPIVL